MKYFRFCIHTNCIFDCIQYGNVKGECNIVHFANFIHIDYGICINDCIWKISINFFSVFIEFLVHCWRLDFVSVWPIFLRDFDLLVIIQLNLCSINQAFWVSSGLLLSKPTISLFLRHSDRKVLDPNQARNQPQFLGGALQFFRGTQKMSAIS